MMAAEQLTPPPLLTKAERDRFDSLDGLRAYSAIGILLMHVMANIGLKPSSNYITRELIPFFSDFTLLFMVVSGFSLCCGYYRKIKEGTISPAEFYKKRYARILPFFALLCLVDLAVSPSLGSLCDVFANMTLCFGLLPPTAEIQVIGVGWFLGVVFLFYMLFPFFVFMLDNKRRAWLSLAVALIFVFVSMIHFGNPGRKSMIFCAPFFISGGLAYLYRDKLLGLGRRHKIVSCVVTVLLTVGFFVLKKYIPGGMPYYIAEWALFSVWLVYAIGSVDKVLNNKVVKYLSSISMEIYLAHMVIFRVVEKARLENYIAQPDLLYVLTSVLTLAGVICFAHVMKFYVVKYMMSKLTKRAA